MSVRGGKAKEGCRHEGTENGRESDSSTTNLNRLLSFFQSFYPISVGVVETKLLTLILFAKSSMS